MINQGNNGSILNGNQRFKKYLSMERSLGHLMKVANNSYFISIGIDEINDGIMNPNQFQITTWHLIYYGIFTFIINLFAASNYFYLLLMDGILPKQFRLIIILVGNGFTLFLAQKIDMFFGEIKFNLSPFKVFYYLINNLKSEHKLTDLNYKRFAILSWITVAVVLDFCAPIGYSCLVIMSFLIAVFSQKLIWILFSLNFIPSIIIGATAFMTWMSIVLLLISYYKLRFDQIHSSIVSIVSNGKWNVINRRREKQLINLIDEHNKLSNEIHRINLMLRKSAAVLLVILSVNRIIAFYLLINFNNNIFLEILLFMTLFLIINFGFGLTFLFSRQIKSAHQSYKLIYLLLCRFKMRLHFRFKVYFIIL